ncbi:MAG: hypothetical protein A2831_00185 [Candidatus Yanofskybacteria bacterium RIFCSPHIGHO2_01_FULL_44_17]|uniref:Uncharacterized protein n=1 Tax=Candidatus Yanofskybacteria bacterium RIFCSPHIGHO2_01_FULL_44_17 TaxID=1802668 RepID=A0A1F8EYL1_9BACT|nr:MAG: hypothetical protein A2831_00185 [Candidatus Yanofskybacteria bacterium RIFCSPHIGHO2_01_FULL_44_17]
MQRHLRLVIVILASLITLLSGCGKVLPENGFKLAAEYPVKINVSVDVDFNQNPQIFIKARDLEINREDMVLILKDALLSNKDGTYVIKLDGKVSFPLGGYIIEIWKDGKYEKIVDEASFRSAENHK